MAPRERSRPLKLLCLSLLLTFFIHTSEGNAVVLGNEGEGGHEPSVMGVSGEVDGDAEDQAIEERYGLMWDSDIETYEFNDDLASVPCSEDSECEDCLLNLDVALMQNSDLPTAPFCDIDSNSTGPGRCTCGEGRCVSYTRDMSTSSVYYYCGPCGWVGARCVEHNCTHNQAKCSNGYCECVQEGLFYDLSFCYYPYFGKTMLIEMLASTAIVVAMCGILAFTYSRLGRSRERSDSSGFPWRRSSTSRESPASDTPPTYDDVVDKLPSYQDALNMSPKENGNEGLTNFAFEMENSPAPPPSYEESKQQKTEKEAATTENVQPIKETLDVDSPAPINQSQSRDDKSQPIEQPLQNAMQNLQQGS
ncbi:uncharacterized protein LOC122249621 [Penaeus japonicus]|uniref:uncharacterized protein LOC122249621 n=1 Tax=Penaeus japonicus TaxID=27405 RepID=UPI001C70E419|nr:uncharacterized protein LOC122249621 [Penaeus japonicus]